MRTSILAAVAMVACGCAPLAHACSADDVQKILAHIEDTDLVNDHPDQLHCLVEQGPLAAKILIDALHPMPEVKILPQDAGKHKDSEHVIWSMRTLRSITGGLEFTAGSAADIKKRHLPENQEYWILNGSGDEVRMYGVWMSRDSIYIAPKDIQKAVIKQWQDWYKANGAGFKYVYDTNFNDWYF